MRFIIAYNLKSGADFIGHKAVTAKDVRHAAAKAAVYMKSKNGFTFQVRRATRAALKGLKPC